MAKSCKEEISKFLKLQTILHLKQILHLKETILRQFRYVHRKNATRKIVRIERIENRRSARGREAGVQTSRISRGTSAGGQLSRRGVAAIFPRPVASFRFRFETVTGGGEGARTEPNRCAPELSRDTLKPRNAKPAAAPEVIESDANDLRAK